MKNNFLTLILVCIASIAFAQDALPEKNNRILLNVNTHFQDYTTIDNKFRHQKAFPSFEFQKRKGQRVLSFELAKLFWGQKNYGDPFPSFDIQNKFQSRNFQAITRFQYQHLLKVNHKKWQPFYGGAVSARYARTRMISRVSTRFPITSAALALDQYISVGTYYAMGKYFLQANALLGVSSFGINSQNVQNPALVQAAQKYSLFNLDILPQDYLFRIGVGMKL